MDFSKIKKVDTVFDIVWYKVKGTDSNINVFLTNELDKLPNPEEYYLVKRHHPIKGMFWGTAQRKDIEKMIKRNTYLYEIFIPGRKLKVYFDIDSEIDNLEYCKTLILKIFPNANMQISGYRTNEKYSFHIVLSNYYTTNPIILKNWCKTYVNTFDTKVYGKFQLFKCINQSKPKGNIQAYLEGSQELTKHIVSLNFDENVINIEDLNTLQPVLNDLRQLSVRQQIQKIELLNINPLDTVNELPEDFDYINAMALEKLKVIPNPSRNNKNVLDHNVVWKIMVWANNEGISFENFWEWNSEKDNSEQRQLRYRDYYSAASRYVTSESFVNTVLLKFYPFLGEDKSREEYRKTNNIQHTRIITDNFLQGSDIGKCKYSFLDIRMGGNKTGAIIDYILDQTEDTSILFISPRIALSQDIQGRMKEKNLKLALYKDFKEKSITLKLEDRLIISINSLHHLAGRRYDLIIIDEIETMWDSFKDNCVTHSNHLQSNWLLFKSMLKDSKKVILMDALMTLKTIKTIKLIEPLCFQKFEPKNEILTLEKKQDDRQILKVKPKDIDLWFKQIFESIKNGKKIFVFLPYKNTNPNSTRHKWTGIKQLVKNICATFNLTEDEDVIGYYAEQKQQKADLVYINEKWKKAKVIIGNTCISVGVNYSGNDFDMIFAYFSNWLNTRDFVQVLYRIRNPKSKIMTVYYEKGYRKYNEEKSAYIDCPAFRKLQYCIFTEEKADAKTRLDVISHRCNISINTNDADIQALKDTTLNFSDEFTIKYSDIPDISREEFKQIQSNIETGFNTLNERLIYEKYRLQRTFIKDTPESVIASFWNKYENTL